MNKLTSILATLILGFCLPVRPSRADGEEAFSPTSWWDGSSGLTWARTDNGKLITFDNARRSCKYVRDELGNMEDGWRLPTILELKSLAEKNESASTAGWIYVLIGNFAGVRGWAVNLTHPVVWSATSGTGGDSTALIFDFAKPGASQGHSTKKTQNAAVSLCVKGALKDRRRISNNKQRQD